MNTYVFLTDEEYTFQPETEAEPVAIENLQVIGFAKGADGISAYQNLLSEHPELKETKFERIFCYQMDKELEGSKKGYNLNAE